MEETKETKEATDNAAKTTTQATLVLKAIMQARGRRPRQMWDFPQQMQY